MALPGQAGGTAVGEVLFGKENPAGRLPFTVPAGDAQLPDYADYRMEGRTYRFLKDAPEFPFGFGLSFSSFVYEDLVLEKTTLTAGEDLTLKVTVRNTSEVDGEDVVQVYLKDMESSVRTPLQQLVDFARVTVPAGQSKIVNLRVPAQWMRITHEDGSQLFEAGHFEVHVGGSSPCARSLELGASALCVGRFDVREWPGPLFQFFGTEDTRRHSHPFHAFAQLRPS